MGKKKSQRSVAYLFLIINTICWGAALPIVKPSLAYTTPVRYLLYRFLIASVLCFPILVYYLRKIRLNRNMVLHIVALELIGTVISLSFLYEGLARTSSIEASLLATATPLFTVAGGILYLREKEERHEWIGLALAFLGTFLIAVLPLWQNGNGSTLDHFSFVGNLFVIAQNILISAYYVLIKKHYRKLPPLFVSTLSFYIGFIGFSLLSLGQAGWSVPNLFSSISLDIRHPEVWLAAVYMATFGSIIALTCYIKGQSFIEASEANLFFYLQPLVFLPLGYFFLRETIGPIQLMGILFILIGVFIAERRAKQS